MDILATSTSRAADALRGKMLRDFKEEESDGGSVHALMGEFILLHKFL